MAGKITDYRDRWDGLRREHEALESESTEGLLVDDPRVKDQEARIAALDVRKDALAEAVWAIPARDIADVLVLAEIAFDRFFDLRTFPQAPNIETSDDYEELAVAYLVRGVADVAQRGTE